MRSCWSSALWQTAFFFALIRSTAGFAAFLTKLVTAYYVRVPFIGYIPPAITLSTVLVIYIYVFRRQQFSFVFTANDVLVTYAIFALMAQITGIPSLALLALLTWIHLYLMTLETGRCNTWIVKTFVACLCTMWVSHVVPGSSVRSFLDAR